jgi:hypothetical protein
VGIMCAVSHRHPGKRPFRRWAYGKGFDYFIRFDLTGWPIERTGLARCASNETHTAGAKTGATDTV